MCMTAESTRECTALSILKFVPLIQQHVFRACDFWTGSKAFEYVSHMRCFRNDIKRNRLISKGKTFSRVERCTARNSVRPDSAIKALSRSADKGSFLVLLKASLLCKELCKASLQRLTSGFRSSRYETGFIARSFGTSPISTSSRGCLSRTIRPKWNCDVYIYVQRSTIGVPQWKC